MAPGRWGVVKDSELRAPELKSVSGLLTDHMVDIFVGTARTKFQLHRDLLCDRSDYFKASFAGNSTEAQQKEFSLPEDNIESFGLFVRWLYGTPLGKISSKDDLPVYVALVFLANRLCLEYLQNVTMDHILTFHRTDPGFIDYQTLRYIYQNTSDQDLMRRYWVTLAAWTTVSAKSASLSTEHRRLIREGGDLAVDFTVWLQALYTLSKGNYGVVGSLDPRRQPNCHFHTHISTPICGESSK